MVTLLPDIVPAYPATNPSSSSDSDMVSSLREIVVITIIIMIYRSFTSGQKTILGETRAKFFEVLTKRKLWRKMCEKAA